MQSDYGVILLCGGMSRRMGQPKCDLPFGDETLLERTLKTLESFSSQIVLSAGPSQKFEGIEYPVIRDKAEGQGPLTGLFDLLVQMPEIQNWKAAIICSCDMPFLSLEALKELRLQFESSEKNQIVIFQEEERLHPFPGLYSQFAISKIIKLCESGKRKMFDLFQLDGVKKISVDEHPVFSQQNLLMNVNTPAEYQEALKLAGFAS